VKHIEVVGQAHAQNLEQFELELVAAVGQGERVAETRVDDGHEGNLTYAVNLLDKCTRPNYKKDRKPKQAWR
jgi:hypothetical protein